MTTFNQFKTTVNSNNNKNTRFVKIRKDRICKSCGKLLKCGTNCLTTNKKNEGRQWYCNSCVKNILSRTQNDGINKGCQIYRNILSTKIELDNVAFDDEGAALAYMEALDECETECLDCCKCAFADMLSE